MSKIYPISAPYKTGFAAHDGVDIYYEESGNPEGIPVLFVHGGPGGGFSKKNRALFNPEKYRLVMFDQRGCGQSGAPASQDLNTTHHIVADIEVLRKELGIQQWIVYGSSFGALVSLAYAMSHPDVVVRLVLKSVFLASTEEIAWYYGKHGAALFFPEAYNEFMSIVPQNLRDNPQALCAHYNQVLGGQNGGAAKDAAYRWCIWQNVMSDIHLDYASLEEYAASDAAVVNARLSSRYEANAFFLEPNELLVRAQSICHIPVSIVHSRLDMISPPATAYRFAEAHGNTVVRIVEGAGHVKTPESVQAVVEALDSFEA